MKRNFTKVLLSLAGILLPLAAHADSTELTNPLGETDVRVIIFRILRYSLGFIGIVALVMVIYGGFLMLTSSGNADMIKKAKSTIIWATAGVAIILGSWQIIEFIFGTLNKVGN